MNDTPETSQPASRIETVAMGDVSSRLSSAIFFLLCIVPVFSTVLFGAVDNVTWIIISIFWAAIVLLWLAESSKAKGLLFSPNVLQIPVLGLLLIGLVQLLPLGGGVGGDVLSVPSSHALSIDPYATRFFVIRLIVYLVFFGACLTFINNERRLKKAVLLVIIFGASMAFIGIMQRLSTPDGIYGLRKTPYSIPFGPFVNQHHFAAFMQMTAAPAVALIFGKATGRDKKLLLAMAVVVMGIATLLTSSRGGVLGFGAMIVFVLLVNFFNRTRSGKTSSTEATSSVQRNIVLAVAGVSLVIVAFGVVLFLGGGDSLFRGIGVGNTPADVSSGRFHFWPIAIRIFLEHPVIGAGFDAFGAAFTKFDTWNGSLLVEQAHNDYLQTLADAGLAGFACVAAFIYLLFRRGLDTISAVGSSFRRDAAIGALAGCFGILIHSFFDFPLRTPSNAFFFLLLAAIATVAIKTSEDAMPSRHGRRSNAP